MKAQHILTALFAFVVMFSANAQGEKESFRGDRNFGIGLTPVLNVQSDKTEFGSKTSTRNLGFLTTGTINFRDNLVGIFGVGAAGESFKSSFTGSSDYQVNRNAFVIQASVIAILFFLEISEKSQIDIGLGLTSIYKLGNEKVAATDFSEETTNPFNSFALAPAARAEWFITQHFSIHTQIGVAISLLNENNNGFTNTSINVQMFDASDLLGSAGFTFYF